MAGTPGCGRDFDSWTPGCAHLLHEHVDVQLCCIQDIAVWLAQPLQGPLHCPAVNVDPAGSSRGQELLVHRVHQGRDLGLSAKAQLLTCLPEAEVFRAEFLLEKVHEVGAPHGVIQELPEAEAPSLNTELRGGSHAGRGEVKARESILLPVRGHLTKAPRDWGLTWAHSWPSR